MPDFHPDEYYKPYTTPETACHRGKGDAGVYGAETTECDSPWTLADATLEWVAQNVRDTIDFVIWTGDSARHDGDEQLPRNTEQVLGANRRLSDKFVDAFADSNGRLMVPIIPTFGNNDFLPHNIMNPGPNKWLTAYTDIWRRFIPEEQRHSFEFGGWFYTEVIPNKLAVFSLNTMFFFDRNAAVDGCASPTEPGYKHMEWLRVQLQLLRERGMKAILMGHVPPARTENKQNWDESCWQVYTLWLKQFRDVVVGSLYGHMNIDHFLLSDSKEVGIQSAVETLEKRKDKKVSAFGKKDYLYDLRSLWADLPRAAGRIADLYDGKADMEDGFDDDLDDDEDFDYNDEDEVEKNNISAAKQKKKKFAKIGGKFAERYQLSLISPSVVPNYLPTLRIFEYNITGLENAPIWKDDSSFTVESNVTITADDLNMELKRSEDLSAQRGGGKKGKGKKGKKGKGKKPHDPNLVIPEKPKKRDLPGPAYAPQPLTFTSLQQYFVNLTHVNSEPTKDKDKDGVKTRKFTFELEYDTRDDKHYGLADLTVRSWVELAYRLGKGSAGSKMEGVDAAGKGGGGKKGKKPTTNKTWMTFVDRAFVGTLSKDELTD